MEALWTEPAQVESRIDADYYRNEFVQAALRLSKSGLARSLASLWREYNRIYIGIAGFESVDRPEEYTHIIRPADIGPDGDIHYEDLPWCRREWLKDHERKGCARDGDLLVEVKGYTRKAAVVDSRIPDQCIVSGSCYRLALKQDVDAHFVQAFLLSELGQTLKRRLTTNTGISYIDPASFKTLAVPAPSPDVQKAIGNKMRKAERLRATAKAIRERAGKRIRELYGEPPASSGGNVGWVRPVGLEETRIDAWCHQPRYLALDAFLRGRTDLIQVRTLCRLVKKVADLSRWTSATFLYFEIGGVNAVTGEAVPRETRTADAPSRAKYLARTGDVLVSTVRPELKAIGQVSEQNAEVICSSGFAVLRAESPAIGAYVLACLTQDLATEQLIRWNSGGTYPAIERSVPLDVWIPNPGESEIQDVGNSMLKIRRYVDEASALVRSAKSDIEDLVDGTLNIGEVLATGESLREWLSANSTDTSVGR